MTIIKVENTRVNQIVHLDSSFLYHNSTNVQSTLPTLTVLKLDTGTCCYYFKIDDQHVLKTITSSQNGPLDLLSNGGHIYLIPYVLTTMINKLFIDVQTINFCPQL